MIHKLKYRLSHLRTESWHRRFVDFAYWGRVQPRKACPYWWLIVPASPFAAGIKLIALGLTYLVLGGVLVPILWLCSNAIFVIMWLGGWGPKAGWVKAFGKMGWMEDDVAGVRVFVRSRRRFAPIWYIIPTVAIAGLTALWLTSLPWLPMALLFGAGMLVLLYVLGKLYTSIVQPVFKRYCPPITWE